MCPVMTDAAVATRGYTYLRGCASARACEVFMRPNLTVAMCSHSYMRAGEHKEGAGL